MPQGATTLHQPRRRRSVPERVLQARPDSCRLCWCQPQRSSPVIGAILCRHGKGSRASTRGLGTRHFSITYGTSTNLHSRPPHARRRTTPDLETPFQYPLFEEPFYTRNLQCLRKHIL